MGALSAAAISVSEPSPSGAVEIRFGEVVLAVYESRPELPITDSPRPYLHPVRTLDGVLVSDLHPADHRWHLGLSLALPFVGPANLWGGRSYDGESGEYLDRGDNGRIVTTALSVEGAHGADLPGVGSHSKLGSRAADGAADQKAATITSDLDLLDAGGELLATELRTLTAAIVVDAQGAAGWSLDWTSTLTAARDLSLGSPATHGRADAGYGGLFLRAAPEFLNGTLMLDGSALGEADARGSVGRNLTLIGPAATLTMSVANESPWFVRTAEYPGLGPAPFSAEETRLRVGAGLTLAARLAVAGR